MAGEQSSDRLRSPRAPKHSLQQAIEFAKLIYKGVHRSSINSLLAYELMGFSGKSGSSATALGSVRQYGLIDGSGEKTRISNLALAILEPSSESERIKSLQIAASKPEIFLAIKARFSDRVPEADEPIRAYLIREVGFAKSGAEETIKSLRETELFVNSNAGPVEDMLDPKPVASSIENELADVEKRFDRSPDGIKMHEAAEVIRVALTKECVAELRFYGAPTDRAVKNLIRYIELMKDVWSEAE